MRHRVTTLLRQSWAFAQLDMIEEIAYPLSAVFRYSAVLLPVVIQFFVARLVTPQHSVGGDYFTFAVIGLAMSAAMQRSLNQFGTRLQNVQNQGTMETLLMEPVPWTLVPVAMSIWHLIAAVVSAVMALGLGALLGADLDPTRLLLFALVLVLSVGAGAAIGIASGAVLLLTKRSSPLLTIYGLAASMLGGAVFPVSLLPDWLEWCSRLIPHAYAIDAARETLMSTAPTASRGLSASLTGLIVLNVVLLPVAIAIFNRALSVARRRGELGAY